MAEEGKCGKAGRPVWRLRGWLRVVSGWVLTAHTGCLSTCSTSLPPAPFSAASCSPLVQPSGLGLPQAQQNSALFPHYEWRVWGLTQGCGFRATSTPTTCHPGSSAQIYVLSYRGRCNPAPRHLPAGTSNSICPTFLPLLCSPYFMVTHHNQQQLKDPEGHRYAPW